MSKLIVPYRGNAVPLCVQSGTLVLIASLATGAAWAAPTDYALEMPRASKSLLLDVAAAGDRLVAVGERGHVLSSTDRGKTWKQARVPSSVMLTRIRFVNDRLGWAVGHDGNILVSQDGGGNWELQRDGLADQLQINEDRVSRGKQLVEELGSRIAVASEAELEDLEQELEEAEYAFDSAREAMAQPVEAPPLMDAWFCTEDLGWASGAFGTLLRTANGGRLWEDYAHHVDNPEELHFNGVAGDSNGSMYLASEWGYVFRSDCNGENWEAMETGYDGSFFGVVANPASGSVFAYGLLGTIYRSTDQGETWEEVDSSTRSSLFGAVGTEDGSLVFVGLNGTAVASLDDGDTFFPIEIDTNRDLYGVAAVGKRHFVAVGRGGSVSLEIAPASER